MFILFLGVFYVIYVKISVHVTVPLRFFKPNNLDVSAKLENYVSIKNVGFKKHFVLLNSFLNKVIFIEQVFLRPSPLI